MGIDCFTVLENYTAIPKKAQMYYRTVSEKVRALSAAIANAKDENEIFDLVTAHYRDCGVGMFGLNKAFRIQEDENGSFTLDPPDIDYGDDNNNSLVTTVTWRETSFLLLGDAKKNRLNELLDVALDSYELIKLPHHGDSNKPLLKLIAQTTPRYAAATVSPAEEIEDKLLAALAAAGTEVFRTDGGTVSAEWTGKGFTIIQTK